MAYCDFTLSKSVEQFGLTLLRSRDLFSPVVAYNPRPSLAEYLAESVPVALSSRSEKARSEAIVTPILLEWRRALQETVTYYSGFEFNVSPGDGLMGYCDFLLTKNENPFLFQLPILGIVEAKKEDIATGFGQCLAQMVAAEVYNERESTAMPVMYGAVTSGEAWRFLQLTGKNAEIDSQTYYLDNLPAILGILITIARRAGVETDFPAANAAATVQSAK